MKTGWLNDSGNWYYFKPDGIMVIGSVNIDGQMSNFYGDGRWQGYVANSNNTQSNSNTSNTSNNNSSTQQTSNASAQNNDFTNEKAVEYAKSYGNHSYNGNFKSNVFEDKIRTNVNGKYRLLEKHREYDGLLLVYENGVVVDYMAGAYTAELMDPAYKYTDKTFDETKLGYVKPTVDPNSTYDNRYYEMH